MKPVLSSARVRDALFRLLRAAFRALPVGESTRDTLRQRFLQRFPTVRPIQPKGIAASGFERRPRIHAAERAIGYVERRDEPLPDPLPATLVAFYLPQFHTIPENDEWWGKGFTEWRNVTRALPQFEGHAQPRLPGDLGFYDLRNRVTMREQAQLAQAYGISAFCMYSYWFDGKTLLEAPQRQWLHDRSISLPLCLCWANENWTRTWDGRATDVLIGQRHCPEDDLAYIAYIAEYLRDSRYLRISGRPLLLVYRAELLPDPAATALRWRQWCRDNDVGEICIGCVQSFAHTDPSAIGFDIAVEFPPNMSSADDITARQLLINPLYAGEILDWRSMASKVAARPISGDRLIPAVNCGWDNEPRRPGRGRTYLHASPRAYSEWLERTMRFRLEKRPDCDRMIFINAWNEWAEGAILEPDARLGYAWLHATRMALSRAAKSSAISSASSTWRVCIVVHVYYVDAFEEILSTIQACSLPMRMVITTRPEIADQVRSALARSGLEGEVCEMENRGRDILPFLKVASRLIDEGENVALKLHTKKSPHRCDGPQWRRELIDKLLAPERASRIVEAFRRRHNLGIVAPEGHLQPLGYYWGANQANVDYLVRRMGIEAPKPSSDNFASGSMFWLRLEALRPILDAHLSEAEFEDEAAQLDGTLAHAVERVFTLSARACALEVTTAGEACSIDTNLDRNKYPYADRG